MFSMRLFSGTSAFSNSHQALCHFFLQRCNLLRHMRLLHNDGAVEVRQRMLRSALTAKQKNISVLLILDYLSHFFIIARQPQRVPLMMCQRCHRTFFVLDAYRKHKCMITIAIDGNFTELVHNTTPTVVIFGIQSLSNSCKFTSQASTQSSMTLTTSIRTSSATQFSLVLQPRPQPPVLEAKSAPSQERKVITEKRPTDAHNDSLERFLHCCFFYILSSHL